MNPVRGKGAPAPDSTRILLVESQLVVREGLRMLLQAEGCLQVSGACNGRECLAMLKGDAYDLVILDIFPPDEDGINLLACIRRHSSTLPVLVLTSQHDPASVRAALRAGANGLISKYTSREVLFAAVLSVSSGGFCLDFRVAGPILAILRKQTESSRDASRHRRQAILQGIKNGKSNQTLAQLLNVSLSTLKNHLRKLFEEFGVKNRQALLLACAEASEAPPSGGVRPTA